MSEHDKEPEIKVTGPPLEESNPELVSSQSMPTRISPNYSFDAYNMPRINCFYHKGQTITNFCCCPQCLIPLCPLCVQLHTMEHSHEGTYPNLESLELILNDIYQTISSEANLFADAFHDLTQHVISMQQQSQITHVKLSEVKSRIIKVVEQFFHSLENDIFNKQRKNSDNQQRDADLFKSMVKERWESHMQFLEELNTTNSMKSVIPYFGSTILDDNSQYFSMISQYLNRFKEVQSEIIFDQGRASELSAHLGAIIRIKHKNVPEFLEIHQLPHPHISQSKAIFDNPVKIHQKNTQTPRMSFVGQGPAPLNQTNRPLPPPQFQQVRFSQAPTQSNGPIPAKQYMSQNIGQRY